MTHQGFVEIYEKQLKICEDYIFVSRNIRQIIQKEQGQKIKETDVMFPFLLGQKINKFLELLNMQLDDEVIQKEFYNFSRMLEGKDILPPFHMYEYPNEIIEYLKKGPRPIPNILERIVVCKKILIQQKLIQENETFLKEHTFLSQEIGLIKFRRDVAELREKIKNKTELSNLEEKKN